MLIGVDIGGTKMLGLAAAASVAASTEGTDVAVLGECRVPTPTAGDALLDSLIALSEEAQLVYANTGNGVTVRGVVEQATQDMRALAGAKLLGTTEAARQDQMLALAKGIYK